MKKVLALITLIVFVTQLTPTPQVQAQVYDDAFVNGDVVIFSDIIDTIEIFDSSNSYAKSTLGTFPDTTMGVIAYLPSGDLIVLYALSTGENYLRCYTKVSGFTTLCSWTSTDYLIESVSVTDPVAGTNTAGVDVLDSQIPSVMRVASNGDIWIAHFDNTDTGRYLSRTTASSGYTSTIAYDMWSYTAINGNIDDINIFDIVIDHMGDLWVSEYFNAPSYGTATSHGNQVFCLDASSAVPFSKCSSTGLNENGAVVVDESPFSLAVNSDNDIFVSHNFTSGTALSKITRNNNFSVTTVSPGGYGSYIAIDSEDRVWLSYGVNTTIIACYNKDLITTGTGTGNCNGASMTHSNSGDPFSGNVFVDNQDNIWTVATGAELVYCYTDAGADCSSPTNGYVTSGGLAESFGSNLGDPTGAVIKNLIDASAGQGQTTVSATVDPTITLTLDTTSCALNELTSDNVNGCEVVATVSANAGTGYTAYVRDENNGTLDSAADSIPAVSSSPIEPGDEEFGVSTTDSTNVDIATTTNCNTTPGVSTSAATALTTSDQIFASGSVPVASEATTLCASASITDVTPAGSYSDVMTITVVGHF